MSLYNQLMGTQTAQTTAQQAVNPQAVESIKRMANMLQGSNNPEQAMQMLASKNPTVGQIMQMAQGQGSLKNLFMQQCSQRGINPGDILSQLK